MLIYLNRLRSASLGEEHDSQSGSNRSGRQIGRETGKHGTAVSVTAWNTAPDGLYKWDFTLKRFSAFPEWVL